MFARVIALLLAVMMMTAAAAQVYAQADTASEVDDAPDLMMPATPVPIAVAAPEGRDPARIEAPLSPACGRMHAVLVFRPPR